MLGICVAVKEMCIRDRKEPVIEKANLVHHRPPVGRRRAASAKDRLLAVVLPRVALPNAAVAGDAVQPVDVAGRVEAVALVEEQQLRGHDADARAAVEHVDDGRQPAGVGLGVVVQQADELAAADAIAGVARARNCLLYTSRCV